MPMNSPGSVSNTSTPRRAASAARKSGRAADAVGLAQRSARVAVEAAQRPDVDELDHRGDDDGGERRLGQRLEKGGEKQQGDDRQRRDDEPGELGLRPRGAVDRGLRERAVDDHPGAYPTREVRGAEAEQLAVDVDLIVLAGR